MSCPKNPKKFLWFKWLGSHQYADKLIRVWGQRCWHKYQVEIWCPNCGLHHGYSIRTEIQMVQQYRYNPYKLQKMPESFSPIHKPEDYLMELEQV